RGLRPTACEGGRVVYAQFAPWVVVEPITSTNLLFDMARVVLDARELRRRHAIRNAKNSAHNLGIHLQSAISSTSSITFTSNVHQGLVPTSNLHRKHISMYKVSIKKQSTTSTSPGWQGIS